MVAFAFAFQERCFESWYLFRLADKDRNVRKSAMESLAQRGSARAAPRLLKLSLAGEDSLLCKDTLAKVLKKKGPAGVPDLLEEIRGEDWPFRIRLVKTLESLDALPEYTVAILGRALDDPSPAVRRWGLEELGRFRLEARG